MVDAQPHPASSTPKYKIALLLLAAAVQVWIMIQAPKPTVVILALGGLAAFTYLASGPVIEKLLLLAVIIASIQPNEGWRTPLQILPFAPVLGAVLFQWSDALTDPASKGRRLGLIEVLVLVLVAVAVIQAASGLVRQRDPLDVASELLYYLYFLAALVAARTEWTESGIRRLFAIIVVLTVVLSVQYLRIFVATGGTTRPANDQQHLLNVAIPLLFAFYLKESRLFRKIGYGCAILITAAATYVTLTRAMWLYIPLSLLLLVMMLVRHRHIAFPVRTIIPAILVVAVIAGLGQLQSQRRAAAKGTSLSKRAETLQNLGEDVSLIARYDLGLQALSQWSREPLLGTGLGTTVRYRILPSSVSFYHLDSSYLTVIWKLGLIGVLVFLALQVVFLQRIWFVYRHATSSYQMLVAAGIFVAFLGLVGIGIESGILSQYRFNLVWAILMGVFERWTGQLKQGQLNGPDRIREFQDGSAPESVLPE